MRLTFLGATGTVTGSKYLVDIDGGRTMVDCGMFQGIKALRLRNRRPILRDVGKQKKLDALVLTHAHIDHSGLVPLLCNEGYSGPIFCTEGTKQLCSVLLPDAGYLQEEEARYANKRGFSRHSKATPLYTAKEAKQCLQQLRPRPFDEWFPMPGGLDCKFTRAGHIVGSACVHLRDRHRTLVFTGDLGRPTDDFMCPPTAIDTAHTIVLESTYGDRLHSKISIEDQLTEIAGRTLARGGILLIPAFAVGRTQKLLLHIARLLKAGRIPRVPVYLNSPMAIRVTETLRDASSEHRLSVSEILEIEACTIFVRSPEESKKLNAQNGPMIILSASGMLSGGRILHHLAHCAPDPVNTILLTGYQGDGTRGAVLARGATEVKVHGRYIPVRAEVCTLEGASAHADWREMIDWLRGLKDSPKHAFITHGEPSASDAMRRHIRDHLGWQATIPEFGESVEL